MRKQRNERSLKSVTKKAQQIIPHMLAELSVKTDWFILGMTNPYEFRRAMSGCMTTEEWDRIFEKQQKKRALSRLRKKQWVTHETQGERIVFQLDSNAMITGLKEQVITSKKKLENGQHTLVVFDFPEAAKKARTAFRSFLKKAEFQQKQLSVWISEKDVLKNLRSIIRLLKLEKWVEVYTIQE